MTAKSIRLSIGAIFPKGPGKIYFYRYQMYALGGFLFVGMIPLVAYIYYLVSYVSLDIIRAILSLPQKLDELKK